MWFAGEKVLHLPTENEAGIHYATEGGARAFEERYVIPSLATEEDREFTRLEVERVKARASE